jgi:hypothetical protein
MLHRLFTVDPYPAGDLTELATRLSAQAMPMPTALAFQQPVFQPQQTPFQPSFQPQPPSFQPAFQQPAPPSFQPTQPPQDTPRRGRRGGGSFGGHGSDSPLAGLPTWAPAAGAAVLGTLAIVGIAAIVTRK